MPLFNRKREELRTEAAIARLAAIVEASEDSITSKTLDGVVTSWNEGATRIFGYSADEMIGKTITRIIPKELHAEEFDILARIGRGEHVARYETVRIAKDGRRIDVLVQVSPLRDKSGNVIGASDDRARHHRTQGGGRRTEGERGAAPRCARCQRRGRVGLGRRYWAHHGR